MVATQVRLHSLVDAHRCSLLLTAAHCCSPLTVHYPCHTKRPPCKQVDVLMAQPLRLGAMAEEGKVDLSSVRLLVLDEADKLFDMGFTEQVRQGGWGMGDGGRVRGEGG